MDLSVNNVGVEFVEAFFKIFSWGVCLFHEALFFLICRLWKLATNWQISGFRATGFACPTCGKGVLNQEKLEESHEEGQPLV